MPCRKDWGSMVVALAWFILFFGLMKTTYTRRGILDQSRTDSNLKRRPTKEEIEAVDSLLEKRGLRNVLTNGKDFWRF